MLTVPYPGVAQLVARLLWEQDAVGSNPATRTIFAVQTAQKPQSSNTLRLFMEADYEFYQFI